ncbi:hypothetical protein [Luteitalea pratensis]|uniref:hypothetical protein n=1 Tax=Luteitalea pratensis TaxID=1855912 RepID=UPI0012FFC2AC|nr:hypothetical protein [Luteitalea pratensis]
MRGHSERGVALPGVLLLAAFLVGVTGWLVGHVRTDIEMRAANEEALLGSRLAESALQSVAMALGQQPDWTAVDALAVALPLTLPCPSSPVAVVPADEPTERNWLQDAMNASSRWGPDTPVWQPLWACHAAGVLGQWPARGRNPSVLVWVADDPEGDGQPLRSGNQRLMLAAVAHVGGQARGEASATVWRTGAGRPILLAAWRTTGG